MNRKFFLFFLAALWVVPAGHGEMTLRDDGSKLTVKEDGQPVLVYNYKMVEPPEGVPERYRRACYIHPLYGLDGDILTQDFPSDHYHHRGVFWVWPKSTVGDRPLNLWLIQTEGNVGARQHFEKWLVRDAESATAEAAVQNIWRFDDDPTPIVRETVRFIVHSASGDYRAIDFQLVFQNVCEEIVTLLGADRKGYGGFCVRPNAEHRPFLFTSQLGTRTEDALRLETPWADVSSRIRPDGPYSGVAILQHPENPGYPHPGWILRGYGFLGASWPCLDPYPIEPGEQVELRYRLLIHRGTGEEARMADRFREYLEENR